MSFSLDGAAMFEVQGDFDSDDDGENLQHGVDSLKWRIVWVATETNSNMTGNFRVNTFA
jgi:hypothetical protein